MVAQPQAAAPDEADAAPPPDLADTFIGVRQRILVDRLVEHAADLAPGTQVALRRLCRLLSLLFRIESRELLISLRDDYHSFNPDMPPDAVDLAPSDEAYGRLIGRIERGLTQANFVPVDPARLAAAQEKSAEVSVQIDVPTESYEDVRFYARGRRPSTATRRWLFGLMNRTVPAIRLRHVVVVIRFAEAARPRRFTIFGGGQRSLRIAPNKAVIKLFTDVAEADLNMLFPGARAIMRWRDKLMLGVPALAGGVPVMLNILPALSVLLVVGGAYLGLQASSGVGEDELAQALAAMSALAGLVGFCMRQWVKFERQALKYQMALSDNLYYRNVCNNAAVFDYMIGTAEDQEFKETALGYYHLMRAGVPLDPPTLQQRVEAWLKTAHGVTVTFDIDDAIAKMDRLGLLVRCKDDGLSVVGLTEALDRLHQRWQQAARADPAKLVALEQRGAAEEAGVDAANEG